MSGDTGVQPASGLVKGARYALVAAGLIFAIGAAIQVFIAGLGIFESGAYWDDHVFLGRMIGLPALLLPAFALAGRTGRRIVLMASAVTLLYVVQTGLTMIDIGVIAAFHAVNSFPLVGISFGVGMGALGILRSPAAASG